MKNLKKHVKIITFNKYHLITFLLFSVVNLSAQTKSDDIIGK